MDLGSRLWNGCWCQGLWFWTVLQHLQECWNHTKPFGSKDWSEQSVGFLWHHMKVWWQRQVWSLFDGTIFYLNLMQAGNTWLWSHQSVSSSVCFTCFFIFTETLVPRQTWPQVVEERQSREVVYYTDSCWCVWAQMIHSLHWNQQLMVVLISPWVESSSLCNRGWNRDITMKLHLIKVQRSFQSLMVLTRWNMKLLGTHSNILM